VCFLKATIGGDFDCVGAEFIKPGIRVEALIADGAKIEGNVFLRDVKAQGEVRFPRATIGVDFDCSGAEFINPKGKALHAHGAKIEGNVFLRNVKGPGGSEFSEGNYRRRLRLRRRGVHQS
jgi:hypothetical protein